MSAVAQPLYSLEFFPPKTEDGAAKLRAARREFAALKPAFCSVTFGAGGSTREGTLSTVLEIRAEGMEGAPHLSCIGGSRDAIRDVLTSGGRSLAQGALGWVLARSPQTVPIPGFKTEAQIRDNLGALDKGPLPMAAMAEIDSLLQREFA